MTGPLTAFVAEDEPVACEAAVALVGRAPGWRVIGWAHDGERALQGCRAHRPDLLLTDIRMPKLGGIELATALRAEQPELGLVFLTAHGDHALTAFRLAAADYLLKPVTEPDLHQALARVASRRGGRGAGPPLVVRSVGRVDRVPLEDVIAFRGAGNYVEVVTADRTWVHRETLRALVARLDPERFLQVHRSCIVAVARVRRFERGPGGPAVVLEDGTRLAVGAGFVQGVVRRLCGQD